MFDALRRVLRRLTGRAEESAARQRYVAWSREKWTRDWPHDEHAVVLVSLFDWKPTIHTYAYAVNHVARRRGARTAAFFFGDHHMPADVEPLFASFGAALELSWAQAEPFRARAEALASEIFAGLNTRQDVEAIAVDGIPIGDLIYDTYLRYLAQATVDLRDPRLRAYIRDALLIFFATKDYFARHRVEAVMPDHVVYIGCGVLVRIASFLQIPTYLVYYTPEFYVVKLDCGERGWPIRWPWWRYRELFATLPPAAQAAGRARGRQSLEARLSGHLDTALFGQSAYEAQGRERLLLPTAKPKMLVMLHDFCDAVHVFRDLLFTDFQEWIHFLLSRARETPFEWYVKPHPNTCDPYRAAMNALNQAMFAELQRTYPEMHFLPPGASNRQLVEEGIQALFTVYGTAGHEFAYMGVPVVNAGDNPHIAYDFNFHPKSREEYASFIARADQLERPAQRSQIEEYHYMNYYFFPEHLGSGVRLIEPTLAHAATANAPEILDEFRAEATPEREAQIAAYFDRLIPPAP